MIISKVLKENNIRLSDKGRQALMMAVGEVFPNLKIDSINGSLICCEWDLKEEDCIKILNIAGKFSKLWMFS